jgi:hypothetical protein
LVACTGCHADAATSKLTSDVLLPGIKTCRQCHTSEAPHPQGAADAHCSECHVYHDRSREKPVMAPYSIDKIAVN